MLIRTYTHILVNADHVAYVALKLQATAKPEIAPTTKSPLRYKVLLCLSNGERIVAAANLSREAAEFLRCDIARQWCEGERLLDAREVLQRYAQGAYYALETGPAPHVPSSVDRE